MTDNPTLQTGLAEWAGPDSSREAVAATVMAIARGCGSIAGLLSSVSVWHAAKDPAGPAAELERLASGQMNEALQMAPVGLLVSSGIEHPVELKADGQLVIALQPLATPANIDKNVSLSTIFSVLPDAAAAGEGAGQRALQSGTAQLAAGYVIYGPYTALVLTLGQGTDVYVLDPTTGNFHRTRARVSIPQVTRTFAINASNFRRWDGHIRAYVDDCLSGMEGPHGDNYNMRWTGSVVTECHRILSRGGVFLYPGDRRPAYRDGRYHLLYECNPIAFLVEQAAGAATTGSQRLLDVTATGIHQKAPLIFGSAREVKLIEQYYSGLNPLHERSQLFGKRGLFRT